MPVLSTLGAAIANVYGFTSGLIKDQYFNLVSLLLPGNGTNGAQNNTFLDGSSNNFTITRNGNTTQGTFSPFSQTGWGAYFDGSNDYLSIANNSAFNISTGDFTLETWVYINSLPSSGNTEGLITITNASIVNYSSVTLRMFIDSAAKIVLDAGSSSTGTSTPLFNITSANAISLNTFTHIAFVRSGSTFVLYINGKAEVTASSSATLYWDSSKIFNIAADGGGTRPSDGYFSNLRLVTSQALFTGSTVGTTYFTPSIQPLTTTSIGATGSGVAASLTGTVALLTCQANRFRDASNNNLTITANNGAAITPFSPFAPTSSYSAAAVGGSGYFDGTGDYLSIASSSAALPTGTQDYSVEAWVYWGTQSASFPQIITNPATDGFQISYDVSGGTLSIGRYGVASVVSYTVAQSSLANQWTHILATRSGNTHRLFVNGVLRGNAVNSISFASLTTQTIASAGAGNYFVGYISSIRTVLGSIPTTYQTSSTTNGTAIFDPPTAPPTTTSQGSSAPALLLNFTNGGVIDATAKNVLETVGNAQISTTQSKWGGGSMRFPQSGTSDYLYKPYDQLLNQLNGNFTIEAWIYPTATSTRMIFAGSANSAGNENWFFEITSANKLSFAFSSGGSTATATSSASISQNTWTYVAVVRNGGTITQYINGSADGTSSSTGTYKNASYGFAIGRAGDYNGLYFTGYIDDFRMTIGQARTITASPSSPFALQ